MEKTGSMPTDNLIQRAVKGDGMAFTALWDTHIGQLRKYLRGWLKNVDDFTIDDICSRSFEKAFRQIATFDQKRSRFSTWLRKIAHNTAIDLIESEGRAHPLKLTVYLDSDTGAASVADTIGDDVDTPLESIIRTESRESTATCINALPELYREIARMRLLDGMQYKEIATELDMGINTVRTRIRRAKMLIDKMSRERGEE